MPERVRIRSLTEALRSGLERRKGIDPSPGEPLTQGDLAKETKGLSLEAYRSLFPQRSPRRVVIMAGSALGEELVALLAEFASDELFVVTSAPSPDWCLDDVDAAVRLARDVWELGWVMRGIGPVDMIIDLLTEAAYEETDVWARLFFHLRRGGAYVARRSQSGQARPGAHQRLQAFLTKYWASEEGNGHLQPLEQELIASCGRFVVDRSFIVVEKRQRHLAKLRDAEVARLLPTRNTDDTVTTISRLPKGSLTASSTIISHHSAVPISNLQTTMAHPELLVEHYEGRLALVSNSLLHGDSAVLPASFRYPMERTLANPRLIDVTPEFARVPSELRPRRRLKGDFYHVDCWNPGHFGHVITEVVSRLWGWPVAKERLPHLKAIFRRRFPNEREPELEVTLLQAYGISRDDIVWVDEPVWLSSVVAATPMWQNAVPYFVHPKITATWSRIREGLLGRGSTTVMQPELIFVSRRPALGNRLCRNAESVERLFAEHGFAVVYPEELSVPDQAALFAGARLVAGFAGSALYNLLYSDKLEHLVVLGHEGYTARYEHLYATVLGCPADYFWSTPDVSHPQGGWSEAAYYSAWEFDFRRNEPELRELLERLVAPGTR